MPGRLGVGKVGVAVSSFEPCLSKNRVLETVFYGTGSIRVRRRA
jgi:hypothetical protein